MVENLAVSMVVMMVASKAGMKAVEKVDLWVACLAAHWAGMWEKRTVE